MNLADKIATRSFLSSFTLNEIKSATTLFENNAIHDSFVSDNEVLTFIVDEENKKYFDVSVFFEENKVGYRCSSCLKATCKHVYLVFLEIQKKSEKYKKLLEKERMKFSKVSNMKDIKSYLLDYIGESYYLCTSNSLKFSQVNTIIDRYEFTENDYREAFFLYGILCNVFHVLKEDYIINECKDKIIKKVFPKIYEEKFLDNFYNFLFDYLDKEKHKYIYDFLNIAEKDFSHESLKDFIDKAYNCYSNIQDLIILKAKCLFDEEGFELFASNNLHKEEVFTLYINYLYTNEKYAKINELKDKFNKKEHYKIHLKSLLKENISIDKFAEKYILKEPDLLNDNDITDFIPTDILDDVIYFTLINSRLHNVGTIATKFTNKEYLFKVVEKRSFDRDFYELNFGHMYQNNIEKAVREWQNIILNIVKKAYEFTGIEFYLNLMIRQEFGRFYVYDICSFVLDTFHLSYYKKQIFENFLNGDYNEL